MSPGESQSGAPDDARAALAALRDIWLERRDHVLTRVEVVEDALGHAHGELSAELRQQATREAHMLAGSVGTFGFLRASELARELELSLEGDAELASEDLKSLRRTVVRLRHELESGNGEPSDAARTPRPERRRAVDLLVIGPTRERANRLAHEMASHGMLTELASSLEAGRKLLGAGDPGIVLLDLDVPEGLDAALQFLAEAALERPVLVVTADPRDVDLVEIASRGGRGFLPPSVTVADTVASVVSVRSRTRPGRQAVLALDDDPAVLDALDVVLGAGGLDVHAATDAGQFWGELERLRPDLVILDLDLPDASGIDLCRAMRADARWEAVPVLVLTARNDAATIQTVFEAGADDFVSKPFVGPELSARIASRLDRVRLYRALAETDHLTRLDNRRRSTEVLESLRRMSVRFGQPLCLAVLDVDRFKSINDTSGHAAGDAALRAIGASLRRTFRAEDVVARWGGDEFVVGMYGMSSIDARERLGRFLEDIRQHEIPGAQARRLTLSAGVAQLGDHGERIDDLYRAADSAMYAAKADGGDRVAVAGHTAASDVVDVVVVDDDSVLREALEAALHTRGWKSLSFTSGEQAYAAFTSSPPLEAKVVLLDWDLPGLSGLELLKSLKESQRLNHMRVIMVTARDAEVDVVAALQAGASDHVGKPFSVPILLQRVRHALER